MFSEEGTFNLQRTMEDYKDNNYNSKLLQICINYHITHHCLILHLDV